MRRMKKNFTLIELIVAMGVFSLLMLVLMQFFGSAQKLWTTTSSKTETFESARIAMNLIANDIQNAYYELGHDRTKLFICPISATQFGIATVRPEKPNSNCKTNLCKVQYKFDSSNSVLRINIVGDYDSAGVDGSTTTPVKWPFMTTFTTNIASVADSPFSTAKLDNNDYDISSPTSNKDGWKELIPYVIDFTYTFYDKMGNSFGTDGNTWISDSNDSSKTLYNAKFPYTVFFSITLLDKPTYTKYRAKNPSGAVSLTDDLVKDAKRTFTRTVILDRGQYP